MLWLLALSNAALVAALAWPAPPPRPSPWMPAAPAAAPWWQKLWRQQADLVAGGGLDMSTGAFMAFRLGLAALLALLMGFLLGPVSAVCGAVSGWLLVHEWVRTRAELRLLEFSAHFREVLQSTANSLRAGRSMLQALEQAYVDLARIPGRSRGLMARELAQLLQQAQMGLPVDAAIAAMAARVPLEEVQLFADAISICRTRGGNLVLVLQTLIRLNVDRFQVRQEVRVQTAEKRMEGNIVCLLPLAMLLLLSLIAPAYMAPLTRSTGGQALIGLGLLLVLIAFVTTRAITRIRV